MLQLNIWTKHVNFCYVRSYDVQFCSEKYFLLYKLNILKTKTEFRNFEFWVVTPNFFRIPRIYIVLGDEIFRERDIPHFMLKLYILCEERLRSRNKHEIEFFSSFSVHFTLRQLHSQYFALHTQRMGFLAVVAFCCKKPMVM